MKLYGSTKKSIDDKKNGKNVSSLEVVEVVLVQYNLVDNQYQQKPEVLYTFMSNKSYAYLLNVIFYDYLFTNQNGMQLEIGDKVNLTLLINKQKCHNILQNQEQENMLKDIDFYHWQENIKSNYWIQKQML